MMKKPKALFIGRFQPFHNGHKWLVEQKLNLGIPCLIAVRDIEPDYNNPYTTGETVLMIKLAFQDRDVEVIIIPDIESVNYGRGVGYEINEFKPPKDIGNISATEIRRQIVSGEKDWKEKVCLQIQYYLIRKYKGKI